MAYKPRIVGTHRDEFLEYWGALPKEVRSTTALKGVALQKVQNLTSQYS
ncbi:hypothetical protein AM10699_00150 [Acaryochloris marina MBIC10699]|nr:hypothetical protein AM10699_00150 [Acaryochloris marina MBIC10699]